MSLALIDDLSAAAAHLRAAMQKADLSDIETAMIRFRTAMDAVQPLGAWRSNAELKARVKTVIAELDSSRMLACLLADLAGLKHAAFAAQNVDAPQALYRPTR
ncbi:hypothetical protein [Sphingobium nicotianae]|uniref:Uncharacterized protein n=1 Tax=Sphingobium nicotianae TaxID=2782607 RepID=A0A9X1IRA6_9SPHN|nr:hypothetical protein [Sphingobium nicotianae]MBT2187065.1 hypothetical protein [Sphingobium nicotianae]